LKNKIALMFGAAAFALAGCSTTSGEDYDKANANVQSLTRAVIAAGMIAQECPRYEYDEAAGQRFAEAKAQELEAQGVSPRQVALAVRNAKSPVTIIRHIAAYAEERDIDLENSVGFCRAGNIERANDTEIGRLLRRS